VNAVHEDLHPSDCHLVYLPLFHVNALGYQMLASMWVGARFVLVPKWSTSRFWKSPSNTAAPGYPSSACRHAPLAPAQPERYLPATATAIGHWRVRHPPRRHAGRQDDRLVGHERDHLAPDRREPLHARPSHVDGPPSP